MYEYVWSSGTPPPPRHHAYDYDPPQLTIAQMTLAAMYNYCICCGVRLFFVWNRSRLNFDFVQPFNTAFEVNENMSSRDSELERKEFQKPGTGADRKRTARETRNHFSQSYPGKGKRMLMYI